MKWPLDFDTLSWEAFQEITLRLASERFKEILFEEYLKKGHKQQGIDIIGLERTSGKHVCIQCKHHVSMNASTFRDTLAEFEKGTLLPATHHFLIATTADLQKPELDSLKRAEIARFKDQHEIELEIWDRTTLCTLLKDQHRIVDYFFSAQLADTYCLPAKFKSQELPAVNNFIPRTIARFSGDTESGSDRFTAPYHGHIDLAGIFQSQPFTPHQICILGDAYEGKSELLKQTGHVLSTGTAAYRPILIELKSQPVSPLETLLNSSFPGWKELAGRDLLLIIDGLDEVPTDEFLDMIDHINTFVKTRPNVNLLFSCRKLFYNHYELCQLMDQIDFYQLNGLSYLNLEHYLSTLFAPKQKRAFEKAIDRLKMGELLFHPFYLIHLSKWFQQSPANLPKNKIAIVSRFLDESLSTSSRRKLASGITLKERQVHYKKVLQQLALALQIAGLNAASDAFLQEIFSDQDIELFKHSALITRGRDSWAFKNALFQEQLAALALIALPSVKLLALVSIGTSIRKIRTKWIQTIASAISILDEQHPVRTALVNLIVNDNMELITLSDGTKFTDSYRLELLRQIMQTRIDRENWLTSVSEEDIASFLASQPSAIDYLLDLTAMTSSPNAKHLSIRILKHSQIPPDQLPTYRILLIDELLSTPDPGYGKLLLAQLAVHGPVDHAFLPQLLQRSIMSGQEMRNGFYRYTKQFDLVDEFYALAESGIEILAAHRGSMSLLRAEVPLLDFLLGTREPKNLQTLYTLMKTASWENYFVYNTDALQGYCKNLAELSIELYRIEPQIFDTVTGFITHLQRKAIKDDYAPLGQFFWQTGTNLAALKLFLESDLEYHLELSDILDEPCMDHLLAAHQTGEITRDQLETYAYGLKVVKRDQEATAFQDRIRAQFGPRSYPLHKAEQRYQRIEKAKYNNDLIYLSSPEAFMTGIQTYFKAAGRKSIARRDLYPAINEWTKRQKADSTVMRTFLNQRFRANKRAYLSDCLDKFPKGQAFLELQVDLLLDFNFRQLPSEQPMLKLLKGYFDQAIQLTDFADVYKKPYAADQSFRQETLYRLWEKFGYPISDVQRLSFLWLDTTGINGIEHSRLNKKTSIGTMLLGHFAHEPEKLSAQVLANMERGISSSDVLGSHIDLCRHLKLYRASELILEAVLSGKISRSPYEPIDAYLELGGDLAHLRDYFQQLSDLSGYTFIHLAKLLASDYPALVQARLLAVLHSTILPLERKLEAAALLTELGERSGFCFLVKTLCGSTAYPERFSFPKRTLAIDTSYAMDQVQDLLGHLAAMKSRRHFAHESAGGFLYQLLRNLAAKSEQDLLIVVETLDQAVKKNLKANPNYRYLLDHIDQLLEQFRSSESEPLPPEKIKEILGRTSEN